MSRWLSQNIELAVSRVREIRKIGDLSARVKLNDGTEVSYLTQEFDGLLDALESAQEQVRSATIMQSRVELSRVVAHNIRSPLIAIEMILPSIQGLPEKSLKTLKASVKEIKALADQLKIEAGVNPDVNVFDVENVSLRDLVNEVVAQKQIESRCAMACSMKIDVGAESQYMVRANRNELRGVISNLLNNALEAMQGRMGEIALGLRRRDQSYVLKIKDDGIGMRPLLVRGLGKMPVSTKQGDGRGVGLMHARSALEAFGGSLDFSSFLGRGTVVTVALPCASGIYSR